MLSHAADQLVYESMDPDVAVLVWPDQAAQQARFDRAGLPRLWLVEPGAVPPVSNSCLEDWLRLPADDADVRARIASLTLRALRHPARPTLDGHGQFKFHGHIVFLSPVEQNLATPLVAHFGEAVGDEELIRSTWFDGAGTEQTLRVHVSRLRRRLAPIGLTVTSIRGFGYVLHATAS
jgi:DNA-binding response OmpR family regulator